MNEGLLSLIGGRVSGAQDAAGLLGTADPRGGPGWDATRDAFARALEAERGAIPSPADPATRGAPSSAE